MGIFEPYCVREQCAATFDDKEVQEKFINTWKTNADRRAKGWRESRDGQSKHPLVLQWISEITEYLTATANAVRSPQGPDFSVALDPRWPDIGPEFEPPTYLHQFLREVTPDIEPDVMYLKDCYAVHWLFHDQLRRCPKCGGKRLERNGWNPSGPREVHGLFREQMAIGVQLRCLDCAAKYAKNSHAAREDSNGRYCWSTTSAEFWEHFEHWELPSGLPHFFSRSAVSSELFDFIVEMRLKSTSAGLAENVKQLHLLEYHRRHHQYLQAFRTRSQQMTLLKQKKPLTPFSKPLNKKVGKMSNGYDNRSISDALITTILLKFSNKTRIEESEEHMRTLSAVAISIDTTFRCAYKATLVDKNKARVKSHLGGFVSVLNQKSQPVSWRLCHSQAQTETQEMLSGLSNRLNCLELAPPEILTSDNCCQIRNTAQKVFPKIEVVQDVWHFLMRYLICVKDGTKNPHRTQVANDIVDAVLKVRAGNGVPAVYHPQPEQERRLQEAYSKWNEHGGVWTAAAAKVHAKQLSHVQKGCLARPRDDIATDGSRIEGSHKGWNSIMRSFASGLEVMNALGHDHVLRHNVRLDMADESLDRSMFMYHTHGSHHIRLTNVCAKLWNALLEGQKKKTPQPTNLRPLPELCPPDSGEKFGLVKMSTETATQYSLTTIKQEPGDETIDLSLQDILDADRVLEEIGIDPALLNAPVPESRPPEEAVPNKGQGVKRTREDDDDDEVIEISQAEWRVPRGWFPPSSIASTSQAAIASTSSGASLPSTATTIMTSSMPTIAQSGSSVVPMPAAPLATTSGSSAAVSTPGTSSIASAPGAPTIATLSSSARAITPSPSTPISTASHLPTATSPGSFVVPASGASAIITTSDILPFTSSSTFMSSTTPTSTSMAGASASSAPPVLDGPSPKKKACLAVAGTPAPSKGGRGRSAFRDNSFSSTSMGTQRGTLDVMFARMSTANTTPAGVAPLNPTPTNEPCLPCPTIAGLTRSQRLFSVVTQVDPRALTFSKSGSSREFFLFMKLRATHKWATFQMSPYDWVCAASTYNTALKALNREQGTALPLKTPRALLDKLSEVEAQIFGRIRDNRYQSRSGGTEFWEHHCKAVFLGSKIQRMVDDQSFKMGKNHICGRCKRIMYPEGKNHKDNHSRKVCDDGVRQTPEKVHLVINGASRDFVEQPPPFPQPQGIFTDGNVFHPVRFMDYVRTFYDQAVINNSAPGALAMHDYAFAALLYDRTVIVPGLDGRPSKVIFKLFHSFTLAPGEAAVLDNHEGEMYLRLDCLSEPPLEAIQDAAALGGLGAPDGEGTV